MKAAAAVLAVTMSFSTAGVAARGITTDLHRFRILSSAMEPTIHCAKPGPGCEATVDDVVLARPFRSADARRGAILLFQTPPKARLMCGAGGLFIKRLIGLPGETVREVRHGLIRINGKPLSELYITPEKRAEDTRTGTWRVPRDKYFFMGDNRGESCDSRVWGSVPKKDILWTAVAIDRDGTIIQLP